MTRERYDAVVVGSGPNGLSAAITLARRGKSVMVLEARDSVGGGCRSAQLTLPGFTHDVCSAVHPLALASPVFRALSLERYGVEFVHPEAPLAHPLDGGEAVVVGRSLDETAARLGADGEAYRRLLGPLVASFDHIVADTLGPIRLPRHPIAAARFGIHALRSATSLARARFRGERAAAVFAGMAAHSMLPLETRATAAYGLVLAMAAHAVGWPFVRGGSQRLADALAAHLRDLGGEIEVGRRVDSIAALPPARAYLFDVTPRQLVNIAGDALPSGYRRRLERYRYGPGVFKVDFALSEPIPWAAAACGRAGTVHLGGTLEEIAATEREVARGGVPARPYVLLAQPSLFDSSRVPAGKHTAWAYCHVPSGSTVDMREVITAQIERFAPGFRDVVLAAHTLNAHELEAYNANYVGGDINGGVQDLRQLFTRPVPRVNPYATPNPRIFICSSSTPPGGGVHGLCGHFAARAVLARIG
jgi:phytoene dehydrogenase-like protein